MFSNRLWGLKAAAAALAFALLCRWSERQIRMDDPPIESLPARAGELQGRRLSLSAKRVTASRPEGIEVATSSGPIRVHGQTSPPARSGDVLSAVGEVVGPRDLRPSRLRLHEGYAWKRPLNYVVSIATLLIFLLWAAPLFRARPSDGLLRSRH